MSKYLSPGVTFCVSDTGNTTALCMCLASVLNARWRPEAIQILCQGEFPAFDHFYLAQLAEWARQAGIDWTIAVSQPLGLRGARDWHLNKCRTSLLWMGDNDVVYSPTCLEYLVQGFEYMAVPNIGYVQGVKTDVNNRRGYKDFVTGVQPFEALKDFASHTFVYHKPFEGNDAPEGKLTYDTATIDTGNVLFNMAVMNLHGFRFNIFPDSLNCGGEDTLMALVMRQKGFVGRFMPWAVSRHLEKPKPAFDELTARGEMLLRVCDQMGLDKELLKKGFAPWVFEKPDEETPRCGYQEKLPITGTMKRCTLKAGHAGGHDI